MLSKTQLIILELLVQNRQGLYGNELAEISGGKLSKWHIYSDLSLLVETELISELEESPQGDAVPARTRHFITAKGKALRASAVPNDVLSPSHLPAAA